MEVTLPTGPARKVPENEILSITGRDDVALVHVASMRGDRERLVEFVDALDPRYPRDEKWVVIVSTQFGCPVACRMCEAGGWFLGNLTADEILWQVDRVVLARRPDGCVPSRKFKVQFARMGEPALNPAALEALRRLRTRYDAPGLLPCVSTTAPKAAASWFDGLLALKRDLYPNGAFQLQFSVNTTDELLRDYLMPVSKWSMEDIAEYGRRFYANGDRKLVLNFALGRGWPLDPRRIADLFDPDVFILKITPLNPTNHARNQGLDTVLWPGREDGCKALVVELAALGFDTIVSIGSLDEMEVRSNCGQAVAVGSARRSMP